MGAALLAWFTGFWIQGSLTLDQSRAPEQFDPDGRYSALRPHLKGIDEALFATDRIDEANPKMYLYGAQYALAPTVIIGEPDRAKATRRMLEGGHVVCDFRSRELFEDLVTELERVAEPLGFKVERRLIAAGIGLVSTVRR